MRMRSTVRPSSCVLPSSCARPALIASRRSVTGSSGKTNRSGLALSVFGGTNLSVCSVSNAPPSSDGVPLEQASARGSAFAGSRWEIVQEDAVPVRRRLVDPDLARTAGDRARGVRRGRRQLPPHMQDRPGGRRECCLRSLEEARRVAPRSGEEECHGSGDRQRRRRQEEAISAQMPSQPRMTGTHSGVPVSALSGG